jgi:hypothetical protein
MYAAHFGLTERPFSLAPDPRYLFFSAAHQEALAHVRTGTWNVIRRLDVPVMLTIMAPTGERHYAIVAALSADTVTLDLPSRPTTLPLHEVERFWDGAFMALWRMPEVAATLLKPGHDLRERVREFPRTNGLRADGVLGEETLSRLAAMTADRGPSLSNGPRVTNH